MPRKALKRPPQTPPELQCEPGEELGRGATGTVWRATLTQPRADLPKGAPIALKRLHPEVAKDPHQVQAFRRECRVVLEQSHPGLVGGIASGEDAPGPWLAMQLVPGFSLRDQLDNLGALPEPQVRAVLERLAGALAALHNSGYLHGDIKPDNVRLDGQGRAVLIDLGFAQEIASEDRGVTGSPSYLSPEELRGLPASTSSEVYSLGVLLYELATGTHPFLTADQLRSRESLIGALNEGSFELPSLRVPTLSPLLDRLLQGMLQLEPASRLELAEILVISSQQEESSWWREQLDTPLGPSRPGAQSSSALPLVGRDQELEQMLEAARRAFAMGTDLSTPLGGALELQGSSGLGKSRLMREFAARVRLSERPPLFLAGRCARFEEQRPCGPVIQLLSRFLRLPTGTAPADRERAILDELLPSRERDTLLEILEPAFEGTTAASVPVALCTWLVRLSESRPVAIFLDDLGFADAGTLEILARLVRQLEGRTMFLVVGRDDEEVERRPDALRLLEELLHQLTAFQRLELEPLGQDAILALTESLFERAAPRRRLAKVLWERSRGNPGLISELLRGLLDRGDAVPTPDGLQLRVHPDDLPLPASLREEILRAYARLEPHDRVWLGRLAVSGGRIQASFLQRAWPKERASTLDETLARLTRRGWLRTSGNRYRFRRPALREAVYKRLSESRRREMHSAVAHALCPAPGGRQSLADGFQRAYHLRAAQQYAELMQILPQLLKRMQDRGQPARVHTLGLWGLEALSQLPDGDESLARALEFLWASADAADRLGLREQQRALLDQLSELEVDFEEQPEQAGRIYLLHARYSISIGQFGPGQGMLMNALQCFRRSGQAVLTSEVLQRLAIVQAHTGRLEESRKNAREALRTAPDQLTRAKADYAHGVLDMLEGQIESALKRTDRCLMSLRKADVFEGLSVRAMAHALRARVYRAAGRPRRGLVSAQHALRFAQRAGERRLEIELQSRLGAHLLDIDEVKEAESLLRDSLLLSTEIQDRRGESIASLFLGILLAEQNDPGAEIYLRRCTRIAREVGLARTEAVCAAIQARILFRGQAIEAALEYSSRAISLLDQAGAELIDRIVIRGTHAMVLRAAGRASEAEPQLERLRRRMRIATARIGSQVLQRRQRLATGQLLKAALSSEGPVYRRV
jgi:serine/threonine protein kinase/tetratricopeptide (TPR) repeat protein